MADPLPPNREIVRVPLQDRVGIADLDFSPRRLERHPCSDGGEDLSVVLRIQDGIRQGELTLTSAEPSAWIKGHRLTLLDADARGVGFAIDLDAAR